MCESLHIYFYKRNKDTLFISGGVIIVSQRTAPRTIAQHVAHPLIVGEVIGSNLGPTPHHTKDVKKWFLLLLW